MINFCNPVFGETCFSKRVCSEEPEGHLLPPGIKEPYFHPQGLAVELSVWINREWGLGNVSPGSKCSLHKAGHLGSVSMTTPLRLLCRAGRGSPVLEGCSEE